MIGIDYFLDVFDPVLLENIEQIENPAIILRFQWVYFRINFRLNKVNEVFRWHRLATSMPSIMSKRLDCWKKVRQLLELCFFKSFSILRVQTQVILIWFIILRLRVPYQLKILASHYDRIWTIHWHCRTIHIVDCLHWVRSMNKIRQNRFFFNLLISDNSNQCDSSIDESLRRDNHFVKNSTNRPSNSMTSLKRRVRKVMILNQSEIIHREFFLFFLILATNATFT